MGGKDAVNKDKSMAAHLKQVGIYHGKRLTTTKAPCDPMVHKHLGSAAQRRLMAKKEDKE